MKKYYMFSQGEYSDYCVGGLYITEEDVPDGEFDRMQEEYKQKLEVLQEQSYIVFGERTGCGHTVYTAAHLKKPKIQCGNSSAYYKSFEWQLIQDWRKDNDPVEGFKAKYNLKQVEYEECWEG